MEAANIYFIKQIAIWTIPTLYAITLHEVAHGWAANMLGDKTAFMLGRLSLNPFKHIDPVGTVLVPIALLFLGGFIFGWAKPVPVNDHALKNPKRDLALVALAGPLANLLMAIFWALMIKLSITLHENQVSYYIILEQVGKVGIIINLIIGWLNLLPIPPLDGSKVIYCVISRRLTYFYSKLEPIGFLILLGLIITGILGQILNPLIQESYQQLIQLVVLAS